jgi:hypothetical protein
MYSWDYTYPNGVRTQNELIVPAGKPVMLRMTSRDTLHSHYIPDFRVKEDSMPGRVTYLWFHPTKPGEHLVTCAEYCGVMHSYMAGRVIVKSADEYAAWMKQEETKLAAANAAGPADLRTRRQAGREARRPEGEAEAMNLKEWIFTTDHKRVGMFYLIGSLAAFAVAGIMALLMRASCRPSARPSPPIRPSTTSGSTPTVR